MRTDPLNQTTKNLLLTDSNVWLDVRSGRSVQRSHSARLALQGNELALVLLCHFPLNTFFIFGDNLISLFLRTLLICLGDFFSVPLRASLLSPTLFDASPEI